MFHTHQPRIAAYAQANPRNLAHVGVFALATIQQRLHIVVSLALPDVDRVGAESRFLFGSKREGFRYLTDHAEGIYARAMAHYHDGERDELLALIAEVPGLGLVKAGFVCQLAFGVSGCVDGHNAKRFGVDLARFSLSGVRREGTRLAKAHAYHQLVDGLGGTAELWDSWCDYVAVTQPRTYRDAEHVSALHCEALGL